jgi:tetratricopeptide (TPR) repeat protein
MKYLTTLFCLNAFLYLYAQPSFEETRNLINSGEYKSAADALEQIVRNNPDNFEAQELLADTHAYQREWEQAISIYSKLVEVRPSAELHYKLGGSLGMKAQTVNKLSALFLIADIRSNLERALELNPEHINAHWAVIELYLELPTILGGSVDKALTYAKKLQAVSEVDGYLAKGHIYKHSQELALAELYYQKAVDLGNSVVCYRELVDFYEFSNAPHKAVKTLETAVKMHDINEFNYRLGEISAIHQIEFDKGLRALQRYIQNYTKTDKTPIEWAYLRSAQIYTSQDKKELALENLDLALKCNQNFPEAHKELRKLQDF